MILGISDNITFLYMKGFVCFFYFNIKISEYNPIPGSAVAWWLMPRTPNPEVGGSNPLGSNRVVSLSKAHLLLKSTGNTEEAVAPSQHD